MRVNLNKKLRFIVGNDSCLVKNTNLGDRVVVRIDVRFEDEMVDIFLQEEGETFVVILVRDKATIALFFVGKVEDYDKEDQGVRGMKQIMSPGFFGYNYMYNILKLQGII